MIALTASGIPGAARVLRAMTVRPSAGEAMALQAPLLAGALDRFGSRFWQPDAQAVASLWSLHYFSALVGPAAVTLLADDRILPVALADIALELDATAAPERVVIADAGRQATEADRGRRFAVLVERQLAPFVGMFAGLTGLAPRLIWSNAAVMLDYAVQLVAGRAQDAPRAEAEALLAGTPLDGIALDGTADLANPLRMAPDGTRVRRICCGRHRLSGVAPCPTICPGRDASMGMDWSERRWRRAQ